MSSTRSKVSSDSVDYSYSEMTDHEDGSVSGTIPFPHRGHSFYSQDAIPPRRAYELNTRSRNSNMESLSALVSPSNVISRAPSRLTTDTMPNKFQREKVSNNKINDNTTAPSIWIRPRPTHARAMDLKPLMESRGPVPGLGKLVESVHSDPGRVTRLQTGNPDSDGDYYQNEGDNEFDNEREVKEKLQWNRSLSVLDTVLQESDFGTVDWLADNDNEVQTSANGIDEKNNPLNYRIMSQSDVIYDRLNPDDCCRISNNCYIPCLCSDNVKTFYMSLRTKAMARFRDSQGVVALILIGICTGVSACIVHTLTDQLSDLKEGYCSSSLFLPKKFCCAEKVKEECPWRSWADSFDVSPGNISYVVDMAMYTVFAIVFTAVSAFWVKIFAPKSAGSGIAEIKVILGGFNMKHVLGIRCLIVKCLGLALSVGSGLSLGKEGPFVHIASCWGNILSRYFSKFRNNEAKKRELVSAACAAGVTVAFGAPIGGILFSLEEASSYFPHKTMLRSLFCAVTSALVVIAINPSHTGKLVQFQVPITNFKLNWYELIIFGLIGAIGGMLGALFVRLNLIVIKIRKTTWIKNWPITEACVMAIITALSCYSSIYTRRPMTEVMAALFSQDAASGFAEYQDFNLYSFDKNVAFSLLSAAALRYVLTIFTFGIKVPAGAFIPNMFVGACLGRLVGAGVQTWVRDYGDPLGFCPYDDRTDFDECVFPGTYAVVGAAAMLGGVTRMTVSLIVIMFELTGGLYLLPALMVSIITCKYLGDFFCPYSIYDAYIDLNQYPYLDSKLRISYNQTAQDVMTHGDLAVLTVHGNTLKSLENLLYNCTFSGFPVVSNLEDFIVVGFISRRRLAIALKVAKRDFDPDPETPCYFGMDGVLRQSNTFIDLSPQLDKFPVILSPSTPFYRVFDMFRGMGLRYCFVAQEGVLLGVITKKDMLASLRTFKELELEKRGGMDSDL